VGTNNARLGCRKLGKPYQTKEKELLIGKRGGWRKTFVAWRICKFTVVPQGWVAYRLKMKPSANVSQQVRRFVTTPEDKLPEPVKGGARIDD